MIRDESQSKPGALEQFDHDEIHPPNQPDRQGILDLISRFLESAGNVLLIQGPPGAGKTTLAMELLRRVKATRIGRTEIPPTRLYVQSRVPPNKLRKHFPWIQEMHDPLAKQRLTHDSMESSDEIQLSDADDVFNKI